MTTPKVPDDRIAMLSDAFAKAFEDKLLWEQMQKAGEYLKLLDACADRGHGRQAGRGDREVQGSVGLSAMT